MKVSYIILALVVLGIGAFLLFGKEQSKPSSPSTFTKEQTADQTTFQSPKKSAHYETNTPAHGATLAGVPINVVIDFNFDLAKPSSIKIEKEGKDFGIDETVIDDNKLSMRRNMDSNAPDGVYTVMYNACWPDGSCHDGDFQFAIDKSLSPGLTDMINQKEVQIKMSEIKFNPQNLKVSKGTKVTWINDDGVDHYVNTDSHPAHTYYLPQNSKSLAKGENFSVSFEKSGIYPYHCSAHADTMSGNILVE